MFLNFLSVPSQVRPMDLVLLNALIVAGTVLNCSKNSIIMLYLRTSLDNFISFVFLTLMGLAKHNISQ